MAAMFLLFLADHAIRDLYREVTARTLDRFRTLHDRLLPFVISKVVLAMAVVVLGSIVMFGGGVLMFGIHWQRPLAMAVVILAFGLFGSGFMAFIAALARNERRANAVNGVIVMCLSFVGGSFFPARQLPPLFRDHLSPLMPLARTIHLQGQPGSQPVRHSVDARPLRLGGGFPWRLDRRCGEGERQDYRPLRAGEFDNLVVLLHHSADPNAKGSRHPG